MLDKLKSKIVSSSTKLKEANEERVNEFLFNAKSIPFLLSPEKPNDNPYVEWLLADVAGAISKDVFQQIKDSEDKYFEVVYLVRPVDK